MTKSAKDVTSKSAASAPPSPPPSPPPSLRQQSWRPSSSSVEEAKMTTSETSKNIRNQNRLRLRIQRRFLVLEETFV
jgi:hypothetical protein